MKIVTVTVDLHSGEEHFIDTLKAILKGMGCEVKEHEHGHSYMITAKQNHEPAEPSVPPVPDEPTDTKDGEGHVFTQDEIRALAQTSMAVAATGAVEPSSEEMEITIPLNTAEVPADVPQIAAPAELPLVVPAVMSSDISGECLIKDLSGTVMIPFFCNPEAPFSVLNVNNLIELGDFMSFNYCGMSFKFPVEKSFSGNDVINRTPTHTPTTIRVSVCLSTDQTGQTFPVLLSLVNSTEGCSVVFGADAEGLF